MANSQCSIFNPFEPGRWPSADGKWQMANGRMGALLIANLALPSAFNEQFEMSNEKSGSQREDVNKKFAPTHVGGYGTGAMGDGRKGHFPLRIAHCEFGIFHLPFNEQFEMSNEQ